MKLIFVYIPCKNEKKAINLTEFLLKKKLIACANIHESKSIYFWKKKLIKEKEAIIIAKTIKSKFNLIKKLVKEKHSYEMPCIACINVDSNKKFFEWIKKELN